jgi:hypothetical protein
MTFSRRGDWLSCGGRRLTIRGSDSAVYAIIRFIDPITGDDNEQQVVFEIRELPFHDDR